VAFISPLNNSAAVVAVILNAVEVAFFVDFPFWFVLLEEKNKIKN
jgi:hypothetical protein